MRRVLIFGAGEAGEMVLQEIRRRPAENIEVLGFMDDDPGKQTRSVGSVPVLGGRQQLSMVIHDLEVNEVIIAMPSIEKKIVREIVRTCRREKVKLLIVPSTREIIEGSVRFEQIKTIHPADLLDREEVIIESERIRQYLRGRRVMVTGAAGSIGTELVHKLLSFAPRSLILLDINENGLFYLLQNLAEAGLAGSSLSKAGLCATSYRDSRGRAEFTVLEPHVVDIKHESLLKPLFEKYSPEVVFHTAAYKHVPLMEHNVRMIFLNNVLGTKNLLHLSSLYGVERFIGISTDKAVYPVSVMGKSKRVGELLLKTYVSRGLRACSVRFGNVLGSNGSVMTVFKHQIERGGPVTITSPDMERYFMTASEAASLVLQAGSLRGNGDVYVLDMGDPIRIRDLAENMIILSGNIPDVDIQILYTGVRDGEKLSEDLFYRDAEVNESSFRGIRVEKCTLQHNGLIELLEDIERGIYRVDENEILHGMDRALGMGTPSSPCESLV
jgi:FlaA1/EpsC-like NDP-sugar epimerase